MREARKDIFFDLNRNLYWCTYCQLEILSFSWRRLSPGFSCLGNNEVLMAECMNWEKLFAAMTWDCNGNYYKLFKSSITKKKIPPGFPETTIYINWPRTFLICSTTNMMTDIKAPQCFGINNKYPCDPEWVNLLLIFYVHLIQGR